MRVRVRVRGHGAACHVLSPEHHGGHLVRVRVRVRIRVWVRVRIRVWVRVRVRGRVRVRVRVRDRISVRVRLRLRVRFGTAATSPTRQRWSASPEASQCDAVTGAALAVIVKGESITQAPCTPRSAPRTCTLYAPQTEMQNSTNTAPSGRSRSEGVTFCLPRKVTWGELMT